MQLSTAGVASKVEILGVLNVTPDSFYDGGRYHLLNEAIAQAEKICQAGADYIDIGGESTRPGSEPLSLQEELDRVLPVIDAIKSRFPIKISIDTYKPEMMQACLSRGVDMVNDINGLRGIGALEILARVEQPIVLMHMQNQPKNMQDHPKYTDLIEDILGFFEERIAACDRAGIRRDRLILDPGFGFGKQVEDNCRMIREFDRFHQLGCRVGIGFSRKATIGAILNKPPEERLAGSLALTALVVERGASMIRTHDVAATRDAILMTTAVFR